MNNGVPHNYSKQKYICDLSGCTYYFDNYSSNINKLKATYKGENILLFSIEEHRNSVEIYITIPDNFHCNHYKNGILTQKLLSKNAHLTYHGKPKKRKISGEIHIKNNGYNIFNSEVDKVEAPTASSNNIKVHPLPICRIELSNIIENVIPKNDILNYFEVYSKNCFFNTIEVHLAQNGYMNNIASVNKNIPDAFASLFIYTSMHTFFLNKIERRPGHFPQALVLQTENFELIILATREYKNPLYDSNTLRYFHTKDYFKDLCKRQIMQNEHGYFIDRSSKEPLKNNMNKLSSLLRK